MVLESLIRKLVALNNYAVVSMGYHWVNDISANKFVFILWLVSLFNVK